MPRRLDLRVHDMLAAIALIDELTAELKFEDYRQSLAIRYATERAIEIISEASRAIPDAVKQAHAEIRWADIAGIGNILRHEYQQVDPLVMWRTFKEHLPELRVALEAMRREG